MVNEFYILVNCDIKNRQEHFPAVLSLSCNLCKTGSQKRLPVNVLFGHHLSHCNNIIYVEYAIITKISGKPIGKLSIRCS